MGQTFPNGINIGLPGQEITLTPTSLGLSVNRPVIYAPTGVTTGAISTIVQVKSTVLLAEMNAGKTLLPAVPGAAWRLCDIGCISVGGSLAATAAATGYAIYGTQGGTAVKLYEVLLAAATQSTLCKPGLANTNILADAASFGRCDVNTALTCKAVSAGAFDLITTTSFALLLTVALEA